MSAPTPSRPAVTAIVLNWCNADDTIACARSLLEGDYPNLHLLVVDNASPDGSEERLRAALPGVTILQTGHNGGYTAGNNRGLERALEDGAEYLLVLNNDTFVDPSCVSRLVDAALAAEEGEGGAVGAVGATILSRDPPHPLWFAGGHFSWIRAIGVHEHEGEPAPGPETGVREVTFLTGCCLLIPAAVVRSVGGFEEDFFAYAEDVEFCYRLRSRGYRLLHQPRAILYHQVREVADRDSPERIVLRDRNRRRLVRRRYPLIRRLGFGLFFYPTRVARAVQYLVTGEPAKTLAVLKGMVAP